VLVSFTPSFSRQIEKLDPLAKWAAKKTIAAVICFYESRERTPGLGVKRLRRDIWEARSGLRIRILYRLDGGSLRFVVVGTHEDVKRFLAAL
jgi:mRNA-degrading endonuclease RelE of RelBE toxin-antitoxin system